jgi:hypothetical protein
MDQRVIDSTGFDYPECICVRRKKKYYRTGPILQTIIINPECPVHNADWITQQPMVSIDESRRVI